MVEQVISKATPVAPERVDAVLERCIARPAVHVAWLNTLSLLEFTGARKIARSFRRPDPTVLKHLAEESRHARFFASLGERVARETACESPAEERVEPRAEESARTTLAAASGLLYFQRLDHGIARDVRRRLDRRDIVAACYYHVTAAIEERALDFYGRYNRLLSARAIGLRLDGVIAEEEGHLAEMYAALEDLDPDAGAAAERYRAQEGRLFAGFLSGIERALDAFDSQAF